MKQQIEVLADLRQPLICFPDCLGQGAGAKFVIVAWLVARLIVTESVKNFFQGRG